MKALFFSLEGLQKGVILLRLQELQISPKGLFPLQKRKLYRDALFTFFEDRALLEKILKQEETEAKRQGEKIDWELTPLSLLRLSEVQDLVALIRQERLLFKGNKLQLLSLVPVGFYLRGKKKEQELDGMFTFKEHSFSPLSCALLSPTWGIYETKLFFHRAPWWIVEKLKNGPAFFKTGELSEIELPITWEKEEAKEKIPLLKLTDRVGSFANLYTLVEGKEAEKDPAFEKDLLEVGFYARPIGQSAYYCPSNQVKEALKLLLECGWLIYDCHGHPLYLPTFQALKLDYVDGQIKVEGEVEVKDQSVQLGQLFSALERQQPLITLPTASFLVDVPEDLMALSTAKPQGTKLAFEEGDLSALTLSLPATDAFKKFAALLREKRNKVPSGRFLGELRPYQKEGVEFLCRLYEAGLGGFLADEMGLGKTVQVLAFLAEIPLESRVLIILPPTLLSTWEQACRQFLKEMPTIHFLSYARLRLDRALLEKEHFDLVILDESQMIKNPKSQTAQAAYALQAKSRFCLSGTPIENRQEELASQFRFLLPSLTLSDPRKIAPFFLRRTKAEVLADLPEKIEQTVWVDMEEEQKALYEKLVSDYRSGLLQKVRLDGAAAHKMEILEALLRLRQLSCHCQIPFPESITLGAKWSVVTEDLLSLSGKVILFSQFTQVLKRFAAFLSEQQVSYLYLDGETKERGKLVERFQQEDGEKIFLMSLKAGGVGLNLTAADYVLLFDPWWNDAVEQQAIDRAHRIGRQGCVIAKRYLLKGSIEEKMMQMKARKKEQALDWVSKESEQIEWNAQELEWLLE